MVISEYEDEYKQEIQNILKDIDNEIRSEYDGDVLKWVKDKLDKYIVGEDNNKMLLWLIAVSKDLDEPLHASVEGVSSIGKTTLVNRVMEALPSGSVEKLSRITPTYLDYVKDKLKHKVFLVQQLGGVESSQDTLHVLMTEKGLRLGTVKRSEGGTWEPYEVEAEGPVSFITTTVETTRLDEQFRTRVWRIFLDDSPEQTLKIQKFNGLLKKKPWVKKEIMKEIKRISLYVEYLGSVGVKEILVPYGEDLILQGRNVRLRRDQLKLLDLISVIAYVTQFYNHQIIELDDAKYIIANKYDLDKALEIAENVLKQTVMELSRSEAEILRICIEIKKDYDEVITTREVAKRSNGKYSQSTCRKYMNHLVDLGYLYVLKEGGGRGQQNIYELADDKEFDISNLLNGLEVDCNGDLKKYLGKYYPEISNGYIVWEYQSISKIINLNTGEEISLYTLSQFPGFERAEDFRDKSGITESFCESQFITENMGSFNTGKPGKEIKKGKYNDPTLQALITKIESGELLTLDELSYLKENYPEIYDEYYGGE